MMLIKKICLSMFIICGAVNVFADELPEGCEAAVDSADRLGADVDKKCDYTKSGLNGAIHRAMNAKSTTAVDVPIAAVSEKNTVADAKKRLSIQNTSSLEFATAAELSAQRYELIRKAIQSCSKGFVLDGERYAPAVGQLLTIELHYHCL